MFKDIPIGEVFSLVERSPFHEPFVYVKTQVKAAARIHPDHFPPHIFLPNWEVTHYPDAVLTLGKPVNLIPEEKP